MAAFCLKNIQQFSHEAIMFPDLACARGTNLDRILYSEFLCFQYKRKKDQRDNYIKVDGEDTKDWFAFDLG